ncbi:M35 family metallo-endopeptidase [Caballeronia sp. GACF4]|uniref:M35 family metallo-endopeptidase n=1 Tax=Caballeronia sp. GACF4 TaxID=2921763 RepID=UPI002027CEC1|nr:M35 family metallo-endopeptidase [Caballeronia sp. GACF4]
MESTYGMPPGGGNHPEWFTVGEAMTNTVEGSTVDVFVNTTPICPNMTNAEFRQLMMRLRDDALKLIDLRVLALSTLWAKEQARVKAYLGSTDEAMRQELVKKLNALSGVMNGLRPKNFIRPDPEAEKVLGCVPNINAPDGVVAHVCSPDTATHTIAIHKKFCTLPQVTKSRRDSMQLTLVHECSHFEDTFAAVDYKSIYYGQFMARRLAIEEPNMAIKNADNIAWYVCSADE